MTTFADQNSSSDLHMSNIATIRIMMLLTLGLISFEYCWDRLFFSLFLLRIYMMNRKMVLKNSTVSSEIKP